MWLLLVASLLAVEGDDVPEIELPINKKAVVAPWSQSSGFFLAAKVGGFAGSGPYGLTAGAEVGYAAPFMERAFALSLDPSFIYGQASSTSVAGNISQRHLGFALPLLLSFNRQLGPGLFRVLAGPTLFVLDGQSRVAGAGFDTTNVTIGADAGLAYHYWMGPGGLGLAVRYRAMPYTDVNRTVVGHGVVAELSYLLPL